MSMDRDRINGVDIGLRRTWASAGGTCAIGTAFRDGEQLAATDIVTEFDAAPDLESVEDALCELNGFYSVITPVNRQVVVAVDRLASYPLFYSSPDDSVYVSDTPSWLRKQIGDDTYDRTAEIEYILTGYTTGTKTLSPNVKQVLAGECVAVGRNHPSKNPARRRWYTFPQESERLSASEEELLAHMDEILVRAYERVIEYADGRPIVVSLSSGHDSRLSLIMLARLGYDDLIALTHGAADGETTLCKHIADDVGVPWVYVPGTHDEWYQWYNSEEREQFQSDARYLDRIPTLEGALGVRTTHEQGLVPPDSVFVTGDGVISTGEHIPPEFVDGEALTTDEVYGTIVRSHYKYWEWDDEIDDLLHEQVAAGLGYPTITTAGQAIEAMERWDWQERQAKFIPRTHVFEFWDYDWWMPLWDHEFVEFWCRLPAEAKADKRLFRQYVENLHAEVADVKQEQVDETLWQGSGLGQRVKHAVRNTRLDPTGTALDKLARKVYFSRVNPVQYDDEANFGIMRKEQFEELQTGLLPNVHAFQVLEVLGRVSFDPPEIRDVPSNETLTLDDFDA